MTLLLAYVIAIAIMSPITFLAYGFDKWRATAKGRRVPEKTLHVMALLGGWPGALLGQQFFRHKTIKSSFRIVLRLILLLHAILLAGIIYYLIRLR